MLTNENIEQIALSSIPCIVCKPLTPNGITVFIYHGWGSTPKNQTFLAKILSTYGFTVVLPEIVNHSSRSPVGDPFNIKVLQAKFWPTVLQSVKEAGSLFEAAIDAGLARRGKIALVGSSTGGVISAGIFSANPEIRALVTINGSPAWEEAERLWRKGDNRPPATSEELKHIRCYDPMNHLEKLENRPILMLHGSQDTSMSPLAPRHFYKAAEPFYVNDKDRLTYSEYYNVNHTISLNMIEELVNWMKKHVVENR
jgi:uncharacterized protein